MDSALVLGRRIADRERPAAHLPSRELRGFGRNFNPEKFLEFFFARRGLTYFLLRKAGLGGALFQRRSGPKNERTTRFQTISGRKMNC